MTYNVSSGMLNSTIPYHLCVTYYVCCHSVLLLWITLVICAVDQGGRHVDFVTDQIISKLLDVVKRKEKKAGVTIKPFQVTFGFHVIYVCIFFVARVVEITIVALANFTFNFFIYLNWMDTLYPS